MVDSTCVLCNQSRETLTHIILECPFSCRLWYSSPWMLRTAGGVELFFRLVAIQWRSYSRTKLFLLQQLKQSDDRAAWNGPCK
ncbi:hypothetical protein Leryth_012145 [Lithospermum erythrorhizon]|nr:hypothetical protein Leryth_012145 [Lithospermum erythrorhizon]